MKLKNEKIYKTLIFVTIFLIFLYMNLQGSVKVSMTRSTLPRSNDANGEVNLNQRSKNISSAVTQIIVVTYWRSGSTWLGNLLSKMPGVFYVYEPLHIIKYHWKDSRIHMYHGMKINMIEQLLQCVMPAQFVKHLRTWKAMYKTMFCRYPTCFLPQAITKECTTAKFRILKTVRLYLQETEEIFLKPSMKNLKIIYLVRDPRAIINSILNIPKKAIDTYPSDVCPRMRGDMTIYPILKELYPDRLFFLRYEDLAQNSQGKAEELWCFIQGKINCPRLSSDWLSYLNKSAEPKGNKTAKIGAYDTENKSSMDWQVWRQNIKNKTLHISEYFCSDVMDTLGYRRFPTMEAVRNISLSSLLFTNCTKIPCVS